MSWILAKICRKNILSIRKISEWRKEKKWTSMSRIKSVKNRNTAHCQNWVTSDQQDTAQKWIYTWKTHQNVLPVLHQVNVCLINDEHFYRWQKIKVSLLLPLCTNDSPDAQGRGNDDVWGVEGCVESHALLQDCNPCATTPTATSQLTSIISHILPGGSGTVIFPIPSLHTDEYSWTQLTCLKLSFPQKVFTHTTPIWQAFGKFSCSLAKHFCIIF